MSDNGAANGRKWRMPAEWEPHSAMWMAWPSKAAWIDELGREAVLQAWAHAANAISQFEPVMMLVAPEHKMRARQLLANDIQLFAMDLVDAWMRDCGPTFVVSDQGRLGAVDWTFNGWGGRTWPNASADARVAYQVMHREKATRLSSTLVNEGGAIHVDGKGTVFLTETVQLNANRNPNWTREEVEAEVNRLLGTQKAIWMERGLEDDNGPWGTDGHIDTLMACTPGGPVVYHHQTEDSHADYPVSMALRDRLKRETDAQGKSFEAVPIDAPRANSDGPVAGSYINYVYVNGGVVMGVYGDKDRDDRALAIMRELHPDRKVVSVPADLMFRAGGGVHCITQQQPLIKR